MAESKVSLKLLIDTKAQKVLFAEAGKDFVDFLFHIFSLPIGTIVKLLTKKGMVGTLGNLYDSIEVLSNDYIQPNLTKDVVLTPEFKTSAAVKVPLLQLGAAPKEQKRFFRCGNCYNYIADREGAVCPSCRRTMSSEINYVPDPKDSVEVGSSNNGGGAGGYVKGVVTYMVMDNLEVKPMSTISGITLINKFNVKDVASLAEKVVELSLTEGVALLKASLMTEAVLTSIFLTKKDI